MPDKIVTGAIIEIGTNSVKMLAASLDSKKKMEVIKHSREITSLGEGLEESGRLKAESMSRTAKVVGEYWGRVKDLGIDRIYAVGTYALRAAVNAQDFTKNVKELTGLDVEILSEDQEASATRDGVMLGMKNKKDDVAIIDIGGGSTEVIKGIWIKSIPIGIVSLTESMLSQDPPEELDLIRISSRIRDKLLTEVTFLCPGDKLSIIGVGGTVTTTAALIAGLETYDFKKIHGMPIKEEDVQNLMDKLVRVPLEERRRMMAIDPQRAETIIAGLVFLKTLFKYFNVDEFKVSIRNIIHGIFHHKFSKCW